MASSSMTTFRIFSLRILSFSACFVFFDPQQLDQQLQLSWISTSVSALAFIDSIGTIFFLIVVEHFNYFFNHLFGNLLFNSNCWRP